MKKDTLKAVIGIVIAVIGFFVFCLFIYQGSMEAQRNGTLVIDPLGTRRIDGHLYIITGDYAHETAVHAESCPCKARFEK